MKFSEVIGQEEVRERLLQMTREGRLPHAIMLCGPQGVGTLTTAGALTIGPGVTLEVDSSALEAHGIFPLISFGTCEGDFASVTVTGRGTVVKNSTGYALDRSTGTMLIIR